MTSRTRIARAVTAGLVVAAACAPEEATVDADALNDFAARYAEAWSGGDPAAVAGFFAEEGSLQVNDAEPAVGRAAITGVAEGFMTTFPDLVVHMDSLVVGDEAVEFHWTFTGTNTAPGGTGQVVRISGYEEWTFGEDGLVVRSLGHYDEAEYERRLEGGAVGSR